MDALRLIAGLGNPGPEHAGTRHNAGFRFLDALLERTGARMGMDGKLYGESVRVDLAGRPVWLLKPATFMNHSGRSVVAAMRYFRIEPRQCLVVHDDIDLPAGTARLKFGGGHGGQNGLRDILAHLGNGEFARLRIGIGHPGHKDRVTPWVLGRANAGDEAAIGRAIDEALDVVPLLVAGEFNEAMKRLHTREGEAPA